MSEQPWMPFYVNDYLTDTLDLTTEEHGVYMILLMISWRRKGVLLGDMGVLKRMLGGHVSDMHGNRFNRLVPSLLSRYFRMDAQGNWIQNRLLKEWEMAEKRSEKQKENIQKRWTKTRKNKELADTTVDTVVIPITITKKEEDIPPCTNASPSSPSAPSPNYVFEEGRVRLNERDFQRWCEAFPHVPILAELHGGLARWGAKQPNWFNAVAGRLAKLEREAVAKANAPHSNGVEYQSVTNMFGEVIGKQRCGREAPRGMFGELLSELEPL